MTVISNPFVSFLLHENALSISEGQPMQCRVCDSKKLELVFDLGLQPWGNHFLKPEEVGQEPFYPLRLLYCLDCSTTQLDYTVKKEVMFSEHTYLSGVTRSLNDHFQEVAEYVDSHFFKDKASKSVLDIGSNGLEITVIA